MSTRHSVGDRFLVQTDYPVVARRPAPTPVRLQLRRRVCRNTFLMDERVIISPEGESIAHSRAGRPLGFRAGAGEPWPASKIPTSKATANPHGRRPVLVVGETQVDKNRVRNLRGTPGPRFLPRPIEFADLKNASLRRCHLFRLEIPGRWRSSFPKLRPAVCSTSFNGGRQVRPRRRGGRPARSLRRHPCHGTAGFRPGGGNGGESRHGGNPSE